MNLDQPTLETSPHSAKFLTLDWYRTLSSRGTHAFWASFLGWALDAFDFQIFTFILTAIAATFALNQGQSGLIVTVTLIVSALGGVLAGVLVDSIGRVRTLMLTVAVYALFTFLSGFALNYPMLLIFRSLQGLGFGGEWAAGAIIVAEVANPEQRGPYRPLYPDPYRCKYSTLTAGSAAGLLRFGHL